MASTDDYSKIGKTPAEFQTILQDITGEKITSADKMQRYPFWAEAYENDMKLAGYVAPHNVAEAVSGILGPNRDAKILDFLCGTGLVGAELFKRGYSNLHGLDGTKAMLEFAKSKEIYKMLQEETVGEKPLKIRNDTYDLVVSAGSFIPGHVNQMCFDELIRIIKPDGHFVLNFASKYKKTKDMMDMDVAIMDRVESGQWAIVSREIRELFSQQLFSDADLYVLKCLHPK